MKLCTKHHYQLTGDGDCFGCEIERLRQMLDQYLDENKLLKKHIAENNIPLPN